MNESPTVGLSLLFALLCDPSWGRRIVGSEKPGRHLSDGLAVWRAKNDLALTGPDSKRQKLDLSQYQCDLS